MSTDPIAVLERLAAVADAYGTYEQRATYLFLALALLGEVEPDILAFILDRADERMEWVGA